MEHESATRPTFSFSILFWENILGKAARRKATINIAFSISSKKLIENLTTDGKKITKIMTENALLHINQPNAHMHVRTYLLQPLHEL